ncbi:MAG TPA: YciI family protein [Puia sp.]|nr:YciI family protein [Puia sp.]
MQQFLLLIREDLKRRANLSPADYEAQANMVGEWIDKMAAAGNFLSASALYDQGRYVTKKSILSDGPFIEAKESISGFILIQAESFNDAAALAQACPMIHAGIAAIEVRALQENARDKPVPGSVRP